MAEPKPSPKPRALKQKRSEATRQKIMAAGRELFSRDGYHATSSKKIARAAKIAVGSFYYHFEDKKELLLEINREHVEAVHDMVAERLRGMDFDRLATDGRALARAIVDQALQLHELSPDLHRELTALAHSDPDFMARQRRERERVVTMMIAVLEPHRDRLRVDDLEAAARVVLRPWRR